MAAPKNVVELLREMVAIPSVNPTGNPGVDNPGEQAMGDYVAAFLRSIGADARLEEVEPGRPNVVAAFAPADPKAHLAFAPHLDTVSVVGMTLPPFDPVIRDGKLYGRGSSDTKGPMAAALWALKEWAESPARGNSRIRWTFLALMGEEAGNNGAKALAAQKFKSDLTLVLEPTELKVVTAHKGANWFQVSTEGVAVHGSMPSRGRNAIYAMRRVLEVMEDRIIPALDSHAHEKLGPPTMNVGTIAGGSKVNIVPDACRIDVDFRVVPGYQAEKFRAWVEAEIHSAVPDAHVAWGLYWPPLDTSESLPWVKRLGETARGFTTAPWFSDASALGGPDCPAVCIGPGSIAQAHTKDEFILVRDLEEGAAFFRRWIDAAEASVA